jgi:hypothetical protein
LLLAFASRLRALSFSPSACFVFVRRRQLQWLPQPIVVLDPLPWSRSTVTAFSFNELVNSGQLAPNVVGSPSAWIISPATDREPNLSYGYVVSFVRHHEHSIAAPASCFMRGLCHHYGVELHNFPPDAIS